MPTIAQEINARQSLGLIRPENRTRVVIAVVDAAEDLGFKTITQVPIVDPTFGKVFRNDPVDFDQDTIDRIFAHAEARA